MHHRKPVLHEGHGDRQSEAEGNLAEALTLRMPQWMRTMLDDVADDPERPLSLDATDAGSVAREFIAAGFLKHLMGTFAGEMHITADGDLPDDLPDAVGSTDAALEAQLTIRMPAWMKGDLNDYSGTGGDDVADGTGATARALITLGYRLYDAGTFPYGQPLAPSENVLCPNCEDEFTVDLIWERTFKFFSVTNGRDVPDLFDDLEPERENAYKIYIESNYTTHGWWMTGEELEDTSHPLYGVPTPDADHPDVDTEVTVCHCHSCNFTAPKPEFQRAWYNHE